MKLGLPEFLQLVGETSLTDGVADHLLHANLSYRPLSLQERDKVILDIGYDVQRMKPIGDLSRWEKGWGELLVTYLATNDEISLNPQYVHPGRVCRVFRDYVMPRSQTFEADFFEVFRFWLFETFLKEFEAVYEFGCGSCYNLPVLARMYPNKKIVGLDWSYASVAIGLLLGKKYPNVTANHFDMLVSQPHDPTVPSNSVAVTIGGMEQLGERFDTFVLYLARTFKLCVHVEPIVEWYQGEELPDSLAKAFHYQRRYLRGFPAYLDKLVAEGKAEIVKSHRIEFGSLYHDYGSAIVWRPVRQE